MTEFDTKHLENLSNLLRSIDSHQELFPKKSLNIFKAAGLAKQEIKHSNLLSFYLSPNEDHGLEAEFIKCLETRIPLKDDSQYRIHRLHCMLEGFSDIQTLREYMNVDILAYSRKHKYLWAIESKIQAQQGGDQLSNYKVKLNSRFPDFQKQLLYLTVDGEEPNDPEWVSISWNDVYESLCEAHKRKSGDLSTIQSLLISQYLDLIKMEILMDSENEQLVDMCRQIYTEHKGALDLIFKYGDINSFSTAYKEFSNQSHLNIITKVPGPNRAIFVTKELECSCNKGQMLFKESRKDFGNQNIPIILWFAFDESQSLRLILEVGPWEDPRRSAVVDKLKEMVPVGGRVNRSTPTNTYSRIWGYSSGKINGKDADKDDKTADDILEEMNASFNQINSIMPKIYEYIESLNNLSV